MSKSVYSGTKAFAVRGALLNYSTFDELADSDSLDTFVSKLKGTAYGDAISDLQRPYDAVRIELALQRRLAKVARSMITATSNSKVLQAYYSKFLSNNLKNILKGLALERSYEDISKFVDLYVEELVGTRDVIVRALASKRLDEAVSALRSTQYGEAAEAAVKAFQETKNFQVIDLYIDRAYYRNLLAAFLSERTDKRELRELIAVDIDAFNVTSVLRSREWGLQPGEAEGMIVEPEFRVPKEILVALARSESSSESISQLERTPYSGIVTQQDASNPSWIGVLEGNFEILKLRAARRTFTWDIFSISEAIGILKLIEYEIRALAAVAFGIEQKIPRSEIMQSLSWFKPG
ncbi:MAG TPA: V-type ATPase subunit [Nitrososphaerales archaeon]|nr:V-type ATPase subunit [Nitrososphaerales archaeon]